MKELKDKQISVIKMQDFLAWKRGEKNIPAALRHHHFDDGWKSQYRSGLADYEEIWLPADAIHLHRRNSAGGHFSGGESMGWEQLGEMRDAGVDIEAHSATHQDLRKPHDNGPQETRFRRGV